MESMIEQKEMEDNCDHRDFNELYLFGYLILVSSCYGEMMSF